MIPQWRGRNKPKYKGGCCFGANVTWICEKHGYSSRRGGLCPICRNDLVSVGYRWRIGRNGQFLKKENFIKAKTDRQKIKSWC